MYKLLWKETDQLEATPLYHSDTCINRGDVLRALHDIFVRHGGENYIVSNDPSITLAYWHFRIYWCCTPGAPDCLSARIAIYEPLWFNAGEKFIGAIVVEKATNYSPTTPLIASVATPALPSRKTTDEQLELIRKKMEVMHKLNKKIYKACRVKKSDMEINTTNAEYLDEVMFTDDHPLDDAGEGDLPGHNYD